MRVDNPEHNPHDHGFGKGVETPEPREASLPADQASAHVVPGEHGLLDALGHAPPEHLAAIGGHSEISDLQHDFGDHHGLQGLDGLHDSVHHSSGLGFEGDHHHSLHDGLDAHHDVAHHDPQHDVHHDDLGGLFH